MDQQKPSIGRVVHYVLPKGPRAGEHRAAMITSGWDGPNQNLTVWLDQPTDLPDGVGGDGSWFLRAWSAPYGENQPDGTYEPGTWHWPERV